MNSKHLLILAIVCVFVVHPVISQNTDVENEKPLEQKITHPNIIKINTLALAFRNVSLVYERGILPRLSASIGIGYKFAGTEPKIFTVNNSLVGVSVDKIQGMSITPELRYYLRACDPTLLDGFYGGVYFKYTGYKTAANFKYSPLNSPVENYQSDLALTEFGVGLELGYQLLIKKRFSIDFLFFGPRFSRYKLSYRFVQPPSQVFLDDLSEYINDIIDRFGNDYDVNIKREGQAEASTSFSFANMRFGLSLGFAF